MIIKRKCKIKTYVKNFPDNEYPYQLEIEIGNYTIPSNLFRTKSGAEDLGNLIKSLGPVVEAYFIIHYRDYGCDTTAEKPYALSILLDNDLLFDVCIYRTVKDALNCIKSITIKEDKVNEFNK